MMDKLPRIAGFDFLELLSTEPVILIKAKQIAMDRLVVIHVVKEVSPSLKETLFQEVRNLGKCNLSSIVQGYDAGEKDGYFFWITEHCQGQKIQEIQGKIDTKNPRKPSDIQPLIHSLCLALDLAHRRGVFALFFHSSQILIQQDQTLKIGDWLAFLLGAEERARAYLKEDGEFHGDLFHRAGLVAFYLELRTGEQLANLTLAELRENIRISPLLQHEEQTFLLSLVSSLEISSLTDRWDSFFSSMAPKQNPSIQTHSILYVEDDPIHAQWVIDYLTEEGFLLTHCSDGVDGLMELVRKKYHLLFADIQMPNMNGLELVKLVRKKGFDLPIILCTGFEDDSFEARALEMGVEDYLKKPLVPEVLLARIRKALGKINRQS